jgi:lipopolysaccharide/colanic/teichoic acid biosynthesis glycosyltransferase
MREDRARRFAQGGYRRTSLALNKAFNMCLGLLLLVLGFPLLAFLYVLVLFSSGRPVLYRGERLGKDKKPFIMYKYRTLVRDAEKIIGPQLLTYKHKLVTPVGKFLRDTRLDELPQLFNILRGDMDFVGPRPERPQVYEHFCRHIRNYDRRFEVCPGLVGYSQLFTPHSSPKRIRVLIDNALLRKKQILMWDVGALTLAAIMVVRATFAQLARRLYRDLWMSRILRRYSEKREMDRVVLNGAVAMAAPGNGGTAGPRSCELIDLNDRAFLMRSGERLGRNFPKRFELSVEIPWGMRRKRKRAVCSGSLYREIHRADGGYDYVVVQYFLKKSFA